jgi:hypothetical protein
MANSAASILRALVAKKFAINPSSVILSGAIAPDRVIEENRGHSWWTGAEECVEQAWGFHPELGFVSLIEGENALARDYSYYNNGEAFRSEGSFVSSHKLAGEFIFFVFHSVGKEYGENGDHFDKWTLYKGFQPETLASIKEADVARWEQWVNG